MDEEWMRLALRFAVRHEGQTMPNPSVGCVLVKNDQLIAAAVTAKGGRPHAEALAIESTVAHAFGATAYVTLEPCAHEGKTPPCAKTIIAAGIKRVFIGAKDPDPRVNGKGVAMLREAGIEVRENILAKETAAHHAAFFRRTLHNRPYIRLKLATSVDGFMARSDGGRWITGEQSRNVGHLLRAQNEAIITGIGTVLADNPRLDCRLPGLQDASPLRIVCDRNLRIPNDAAILDKNLPMKTIVATTSEALKANPAKAEMLQKSGAEIYQIEGDFLAGLNVKLAGQGISSALVEAGPALLGAFLKSGLANEIYWLRADFALENKGNFHFVPDVSAWDCLEKRNVGKDTLTIYRKPASV